MCLFYREFVVVVSSKLNFDLSIKFYGFRKGANKIEK